MVSLKFQSRFCARMKGQGRHSSYSKNAKEAMQRKMKVLMRILKKLLRLLKKFRQDNKIVKHVYHDMYMKVKENVYKNKRVFMENILMFSRERKFARTKEKGLDQGRGRERAAAAPAPPQAELETHLVPS